jgi:hypothetical protein
MFYRFNFFALLFLLGISGCTSHSGNEKAYDTFTTNIYPDGSKRFTIAIIYKGSKQKSMGDAGNRSVKKRDGGSRSGEGKGGRGNSGQKRDNKQKNSLNEERQEAIIELLALKISETGFCRDGYFELGSSQMRNQTEIVGECQESASDEDRQRWN